MATSRTSSGLPYPERFYVAAAYAGFGGSPGDSTAVSRFQNDVALLLYGLYQQATVGPCTAPKPRAWNPVEQSKWTSWHGLGNMASTEAMRLFVKILEEEEPAWYSRVPQVAEEPSVDVEMFKPKLESASQSTSEIGDSLPEIKTISSENGLPLDMEDKDVIKEGLDSVGIYDQWVAPPVSGQRPKPRYAHGAAVLHDKMYIFGGNHNGRYLNDLQVLDLKTLSWSRIEAKELAGSLDSSNPASVAPSAGHSLIPWGGKILSIAGHTKDPSEAIIVKEFDPATCLWSNLKTYGKPPISRGGQSVTLVGNTLVIFGGEDAKRSLLNDLNILDLETMTWDDIDAIGAAPSPRSEHAAACHADQYLLIFGGGSHATCFNDLHMLDLQTMEWSEPEQQGVVPGPRAGHAGITIRENWFIAGGGNNKNGVSETLVLNMATLVWSVVTTVEGRVPLASEGLSLLTNTHKGEDFLLSFGGYNGRYNNEVYVLKPSHVSHSQSRMIDGPESDTIAVDASRDMEPEFEVTQNKKIKEIVVDNGDSEQMSVSNKETIGHIVETLDAEKRELEATLDKEQMHTVQLKQESAVAEMKNSELTKELQSVRGQLAAEQSRCFKLEIMLRLMFGMNLAIRLHLGKGGRGRTTAKIAGDGGIGEGSGAASAAEGGLRTGSSKHSATAKLRWRVELACWQWKPSTSCLILVQRVELAC
ncbi:acyl-CoA-binding domain-containing protein 6-like isoform X1 [Zingiber officinale]|uniref:acyl-CoA-binding domain-containing protein 6-like isoform X1 n=1 Tax=Zingiber officinale TaxID=94328 RepID=UPI001C4B5830|nr:acyl-CoA-binding domain-containing protein 6-like isoform X1 [Zingiber officinale]